MRRRILGLLGGNRRRRILVALVPIAALGAFLISNALAVHQTGAFELDGNATSTAPGLPDDWDRVCHEVTITNDTSHGIPDQCTSASDTNGADEVSWTEEADVPGDLDDSIFTGGGSKDPKDISEWAWKNDAGGLPQKDNLLHSFAARYNDVTVGSDTSDYLFFGSDRYANDGDSQQGFWFLQDPDVALGTNSIGGGTGFNGQHRDGDLLVISDFSNGGTTSTISVYKWDPSCTKGATKPQAGQPAPAGCGDANLLLLATSANANCANPGTPDNFCGIVNGGTTPITSPWSFTDTAGSSAFRQGEFFEGGLNLTKLDLADECFSTLVSESRASTSTTATLKDLVIGPFGKCEATMSTTASSTGSVAPGTAVNDTATVTGSNANVDPSSPPNVFFHLCKITATKTDCSSGGDPVPANDTTGVALTGNGDGTADATSANVNTATNPLSPGKYCFRADWAGDSNYQGALKAYGPAPAPGSDDECFTVKDTSSVTSAQNWLPNDSATVSAGGGSALSGTLTFQLYTGDNCGATSGSAVSGQTYTFTLTNASTQADRTKTTTNGSDPSNTYKVTASGLTQVSWKVTFTSSNPNIDSPASPTCEKSDVTITN